MFNFLKKKKKEEPENISDILAYLKKIEKKEKELEEELNRIKKESFDFIKKTGLVRYNPFSGTGGDQSFSAVFLNKKNDGLIITGLYNQGSSSVYSKLIEKGVSNYPLSEEEKNILEETIKKQ